MPYRENSTADAFARALWLVDNQLLDIYAGQRDEDKKTVLRLAMQREGLRDEPTAVAAVDRLLNEPPTVIHALDDLCNSLFELRGGLPTVRHNPLARRLVRIIDPDALASLHAGLTLVPGERFGWPALPMGDDDGADLLRDGSVDTHIHLGGTLPPSFYWITLVGGDLPLEWLGKLTSPVRRHADLTAWQRAVARTIWYRLALARWLQGQGTQDGQRAFPHLPAADAPPWDPFRDLPSDPACGPRAMTDAILALGAPARARALVDGTVPDFFDPLRCDSDHCHYAAGERRLLAGVGERLRRARACDSPDHPAEKRLLAYLRTRNAFHHLLCHDDGPQGLLRFVETFGRRGFQFGVIRQRRERGRRQRRYRRLLRRLERTRTTAALDAQMVEAFGESAPSPELGPPRGVEMRVSIPRGPHCLLTLRAWCDGLLDHLQPPDGTTRGTQIGLMFHLNKGGTEQDALDAARRLGSVLVEYPALRRFIVGVDAAGKERGSPPRIYGKAFAHLRRLQAEHRPGPGEPPIRLGWTYHVGEDMDDLVSGLRHADEVVAHLLNRGVGRLGHGLALAIDAQSFYRNRGGEVELSLGAHLLDLVWAWGRLVQAGEARDALWLEGLIHARAPDRRGTRPDIARCYQAMGLDPLDPGAASAPGQEDERTLCSERKLLRALRVDAKADLEAPVTLRADARWIGLVTTLQRILRDRLARCRVTVEVNPTSNLIIGGFQDYQDLPYRVMVDSGLAVSVNTDDPGLFMTSLPNEYAALYQALVGPMTHQEVSQWLQARRLDAGQSSFLGTHVPAGGQAVERLRDEDLFAHRPDAIPAGI